MKVLHVFDTKAEAARALGVSGEAVRKWCVDGVPAERVIPVCAATGWKVTPHMLRPDIYPNPSDALPLCSIKALDQSAPAIPAVNAEKQLNSEKAAANAASAPAPEPIHECASGDPRCHPDRRRPEKRQRIERRKENVVNAAGGCDAAR